MRHKSLAIFSVVALVLSLSQAAIPGNDLAACQQVANMFDNTCQDNSAPIDLASHGGATVSCSGYMRCPGTSGEQLYTATAPCTFTRKLCVSCAQSSTSSSVLITVQTNSLPNHCFMSTVNVATASETEWSVVFNANVTNQMNYVSTDFDTSAKTDEKLCDLQRTASTNMNAWSSYTSISRRRELHNHPPPNGGGGGTGSADMLGTASGIALTGAYIFNALDGNNLDAVEQEGDTLDVCLSHPTPNSQFHYHFWGSCMIKDKGYWSNTQSPPLCRDNSTCTTATGNFTREASYTSQSPAYNSTQYDTIIGLARDGHMIIGPYKPDGTTWGCDRDVCNGAFVDGSYVYVGSDNFPYVVGCWGPGPSAVYLPTCTSNGCGTGSNNTTPTDNSSNNNSNGSTTDNTINVLPTADKGAMSDFLIATTALYLYAFAILI